MQTIKRDLNSGDLTFNVFLEITPLSCGIKYEFNKELNCLEVDRLLATSMEYPAPYGFIPKTIGGDNDPVDVFVVLGNSRSRLIPGVIIECRAVGMLETEDEAGKDIKILAVPGRKVDPLMSHIDSYKQFPPVFLEMIKHFLENYKALEPGKWVKVNGWKNAASAMEYIQQAAEKYHKIEQKD